MKPEPSSADRLLTVASSLNLSGLTMTKVILWLIAITIVSFVIGFGILALSVASLTARTRLPPPSTKPPSCRRCHHLPAGRSILRGGQDHPRYRDFTVRCGARQDNLMEATVYAATPGMQPGYAVSVNGSFKTLSMTETGHTKKDWVFANSPNSWNNTWDVVLGDLIPVALTVNAGAGDVISFSVTRT